MKLKSFGCSFLFGADLYDLHETATFLSDGYQNASQHTWPALLAKQKNMDYVCYASVGCGNISIAERALTHAANSDPTLFVIGWTWIDRYDFTHSDDDRNRWESILPTDDNDVSHLYYKNLHSEFRDKFTSLLAIKSVIDTLNQKHCPFIMTYIDDLLFDSTWNITPAVIELQNYIKPYMTDFEGKNFIDWSREKGYPISDSLHPLEQAHISAADHMLPIVESVLGND